MEANKTLNKVRAMLGIQVKFEQTKLDNGTVLEAEAFEAGQEIFVVNEDERIPVPQGEYNMEDGRILVVAEDGIIGEIKEAEAQEEEAEVEQKEEVEMEQETKEPKKVVKSISEEVFFSTIESLTKKIEALELALQPKEEEVEEKVEMSAEPKQTISHNPETETIKRGFRMSPQKRVTTQDRVFRKLANK
jgi:hypothetical protein